MSLYFHQFVATTGILQLNIDTGAPVDAVYSQGISSDIAGAANATNVPPPTAFFSGTPFGDFDRICVEDAPVAYYDQGLGFTASHAIAATTDATGGHYNQGYLFGPDGKLFGNPEYPPVIPSNLVCYTVISTEGPRFYRMDTVPWGRVRPISSQITSSLAADYSNRNSYLAIVGGGTLTLEVWDTTTWPFTSVYTDDISPVNYRCARFSHDGSMLSAGTSGSGDRCILFDTADWTKYQLETAQCLSTAFNYNDTLMALGINAGGARLFIYDVSTLPPTTVPLPTPVPPNNVLCVDFHPTENILVCGMPNGDLIVYDMDTSLEIDTIATGGAVYSVRWDSSGTRLALSPDQTGGGNKLKIYDTTDLRVPANWTEISVNNIPTTEVMLQDGLSWSGDDVYLAGPSNQETPVIRAWDTQAEPYPLVPDFADSPGFSYTGSTFLSASSVPVAQPPPQVQNVNAAGGDSVIDVTWDATIGEPPVTNYRVEWAEAGQLFTRFRRVGIASFASGQQDVGNVTSYQITGLDDGTTYDVRVAAENYAGFGAWSEISTAQTEGVPAQITTFAVVPGIEQAELTWAAPQSDPALTGYAVQIKLSARTNWSDFVGVGAGQLSQIIFGLSASTYDFRIAGINAQGQGPWSAVQTVMPTPIAAAVVGRWDETTLPEVSPVTEWPNAGTYSDWSFNSVIGNSPENLTLDVKKGKACLHSASDAALVASSFTAEVQPYTVCVCAAPENMAGKFMTFIRDDDGGTVDTSIRDTEFTMWAGDSEVAVAAVPGDGTEVISIARFAGTAVIRGLVNQGEQDVTNTGFAGGNNLQVTTLLWRQDLEATRDYEGPVYEARVYDDELTAAETDAVIGAFKQRWWVDEPYIDGTPDTITDLAATNGDIEQATISFSAPASPATISGYDIQLKHTADAEWLNFYAEGTATSQVIFALDAAEWQFRVRARAGGYVGDWSNVATATPIAISAPLVGWYKEDGLSGDQATTQWANSGSEPTWDMTNVVGTNTAGIGLAQLKGKNFLALSGDIALQSVTPAEITQPFTHFHCHRPFFLDPSARSIISSDSVSGPVDFTVRQDSSTMYCGATLLNNLAPPVGGPQVLQISEANGGGSTLRVLTSLGGDTSSGGNAGSNGYHSDMIGWNSAQSASRSYVGSVLEYRIYNGTLTTAEKDAVIGAIQQRWFDGYPYIG